MDDISELRERIVKLEYRVDELESTFKNLFDRMFEILESKMNKDKEAAKSDMSFYYER